MGRRLKTPSEPTRQSPRTYRLLGKGWRNGERTRERGADTAFHISISSFELKPVNKLNRPHGDNRRWVSDAARASIFYCAITLLLYFIDRDVICAYFLSCTEFHRYNPD